MRQTLANLAPLLHLTRLTVGVGAVANSWFIVLWSRANQTESITAPPPLIERPLWLVLLGAAACSVGVYAFATVLNDLLDRRRDASLHPNRPLPSGQISVPRATALLMALLATSLTGAWIMGWPAVFMTLGVTTAVIGYNTFGKFVPSAGLVLLSLIYGGQMMTPNVHLAFVWPVWLAMTHALAVGAMAHRAGERRPVLSRRAKIAAVAGWAFWSGVLIAVGVWREGAWPQWVSWKTALFPAFLGLLFLHVGRGVIRLNIPPATKAAMIQRAGALWLPMYGAAWLLDQGHTIEACIILALGIAGLIAMTLLRGVFDLAENPTRFLR